MFSIVLGIIGSAFDGISTSFWKKSLDEGVLSKTMFKYFTFIVGFFIMIILYFIFGLDFAIFSDYKYFSLAFIITVASVLNTFLRIKILKETKISELLPYDNLDKLFIIIIASLIYYGTDKQTGVITLITTLSTIVLIVFFNVDFKTFKFSRNIKLFFIFKLVNAIIITSIGYILLKYSNITFVFLTWGLELILYTLVGFLLRDSFKAIFYQTKSFYKNRIGGSILGWTSYIIGLYIIESSGLIIATLLAFIGIVLIYSQGNLFGKIIQVRNK